MNGGLTQPRPNVTHRPLRKAFYLACDAIYILALNSFESLGKKSCHFFAPMPTFPRRTCVGLKKHNNESYKRLGRHISLKHDPLFCCVTKSAILPAIHVAKDFHLAVTCKPGARGTMCGEGDHEYIGLIGVSTLVPFAFFYAIERVQNNAYKYRCPRCHSGFADDAGLHPNGPVLAGGGPRLDAQHHFPLLTCIRTEIYFDFLEASVVELAELGERSPLPEHFKGHPVRACRSLKEPNPSLKLRVCGDGQRVSPLDRSIGLPTGMRFQHVGVGAPILQNSGGPNQREPTGIGVRPREGQPNSLVVEPLSSRSFSDEIKQGLRKRRYGKEEQSRHSTPRPSSGHTAHLP